MIFLLPALAQSPVDSGPASAPVSSASSASSDTPAEAAPRPTLPHLILEQVTGFLGLPGPVQAGQAGTKASSAAARSNGYGSAHGPAYDTFPQDDPTPGRRNGTLKLSELKPLEIARDKARNYGTNWLNTSAETLLSGLVDNGRARVNFNIDWDGHLQGEGDVLLPIHDSPRTTVFTQIGARSMASSDSKDRWIGNFGLGQRWFPYAQDLQNAGHLMLGYNAFFDQDFSRSHQRGSVGGEIQYDWLRLASNYYFPLSGWRASPDFDHRLIEERPAKGWDVRVKAWLPTYRNLAFTGAYTRWSGEHVGVSGARHLEKDPREWSWGVEYTPIPLFSGFVRSRHVEGSRNDTEFGLNFTYHFGMPWEQQLRHSKVAELRTVSASRHEFVDRENKIILEYKARKAYHIELTGFNNASGEFVFRLRNGFDEFPDGVTVNVRANNGATLARNEAAAPASFLARAADALRGIFSIKTAHAADFSKTYVTSGGGYIRGTLSNTVTGPVTVTAQAGDSSATVTLNVIGSAYTLEATPAALTQNTPAGVTFTVKQGGVEVPSGTAVSFTANPNFNLPNGASTDGSGQITVANLTATASGTQTVTATVGGQTVSVSFAVTAAYTLDAAPTALIQNTPASVTFTVMQGGAAVPLGTAVTFAANPDMNLPSGAQSTDGSGQITLNLTATASGAQTVTATVGGQTVSVDFTVTAASYTLEASPPNLTQHVTTPVTFTVKRNNVALASTPVSFTPNPDFTNLPSGEQNTNPSGEITVSNLTATASGVQTVSATVGGQTVSVDFTVTAASYTLEASPPNLTQHAATPVTFTVKRNNVALASTPVSFTPNPDFTNLPSGEQNTNPSGEITVANLTATTSGPLTVSATVDGQTVSVDFTVAAPCVRHQPERESHHSRRIRFQCSHCRCDRDWERESCFRAECRF
ncbi:hypothetical protein FACS189475_01040 [Betaproteobacteria bacterium]|nr:hypothetical protein FACS189475_01040 [Betaproteobacteria bacterium]